MSKNSRLESFHNTRHLLFLSLILFFAAPAAAGENMLMLVENGKSDYAIVIPDGDVRPSAKQAANLLQSSVAESTGVKLPIVAESEKPADRHGIYLGATKAAGVLPQTLSGWTYAKTAKGNDIFLVGQDRNLENKRVSTYEYEGTLKAVTSFLDEELGVKFLLPGKYGTFVPKRETLSVPMNLNSVQTPPFVYCTGRHLGGIYDLANHHFHAFPYRTYGGHSHNVAVNKDEFGETHPEYFAEFGGVRVPQKLHLCISNPDVFDLMIKEIERNFEMGYDWAQIGQTDGYQPCECEKCKAMHPDPNERLWILHKHLAEIIKKKYPDKKLVLLSYGPTTNPPFSFDRFPGNVIIELCKYTPEHFAQWRKFADSFLVYIYNWGTYQTFGFAPKRTPRFAAEQVRLFRDNKVRGIYKCGFGENLGLEGPTYYVYGRMLGDPDADYTKFEDEYYAGAYGNACAPMRNFFTRMYERMELYTTISGTAQKYEHAGMMPRIPEDVISYFFPPKLLLKMESDLAKAKKIAETEDEGVQARIRLVEREFAYLKNLSAIFYMYHTYRLQPDWESFNRLGNLIEERNALIDSWYDADGKMIDADSWTRFFDNVPKSFLQQGGRLTGVLSAPFNWDVKLLREKKVLPGVGKKTQKVVKANTPVKLDGIADEELWGEIPENELGEIGMGKLQNPSRFRVAYDKENVYLSFTCEILDGRETGLKPVGVDGAAWSQECIEIFLDPFGQQEKYFHFIFNPVAQSCYDGNFGFIEDPIDPNYGKEDKSWNGKWDYAVKVDGKVWTAEVRIPFATLGVAVPEAGTTWTMNLGRERPYQEDGVHKIELSLWSPNLESRGFGALHAFGNLVFE
jgi:hypothetical protein